MKAIAIDGYGDAGDLQPREAPDPKPGDEEILIRVRASGVNPLDWKIRQGQLRLFLRLRFPYVLGSDVAGEVVSTGILAKRFKLGDPVFAFSDPKRGGAYAELAVVNQAVAARKPDSLDFAETASLPIAGCTALQALRDIGRVSQGSKVLVHGGAGGVGHFAVQIAKALGAMTTATCGPANVDFVRSLGADFVIDYSRQNILDGRDRYDVIFDAVREEFFLGLPPSARSRRNLCHHAAKPRSLLLGAGPAGRQVVRPSETGATDHGPAEWRGSRLSRWAGRQGEAQAHCRFTLQCGTGGV